MLRDLLYKNMNEDTKSKDEPVRKFKKDEVVTIILPNEVLKEKNYVQLGRIGKIVQYLPELDDSKNAPYWLVHFQNGKFLDKQEGEAFYQIIPEKALSLLSEAEEHSRKELPPI